MTIKKIGISAIVAVALSSSAFAEVTVKQGTSDASSSYSELFMAKIINNYDINTSVNEALTYSGVGLNEGYTLKFTLSGAEFYNADTLILSKYADPEATETKIQTSVGINPAISDDKTSIEFTIGNFDITALDNLYLSYGVNQTTGQDDSNETGMFIKPGVTGDIKVTVTAKNKNEEDLDVAKAELIFYSSEASELEATVKCANDEKVYISSADRASFNVDDDNFVESKKITCALTLDKKPPSSDLDFIYDDINATITFNGGDFDHGKFIANPEYGVSVSEDGKIVTIVPNSSLGQGDSISFKYELNYDLVELSPTIFNSNITLNYKNNVGSMFDNDQYNEGESIMPANDNVMEWDIDTYLATVWNVRHNATIGLRSMISIYNNSAEAVPVTVTIVNSDGAGKTDAPITLMTLEARQSTMLITNAVHEGTSNVVLPDTLVNGYNLKIGIASNKTEADVIAYQRNNDSKTILKVTDDIEDK